MIAVSIDNLIFFLLIAVAALFQLLSKAVTKTRKSDSNETSGSSKPQAPRPTPRAPRESDADRIRKFLEALGQPPSSTPPQPVLPRTNIPPRTLAPVKPPPVLTPVWSLPLERQQKSDVRREEIHLPTQPSRLQEVVLPAVVPPATPAFEIHESLSADLQQPAMIPIAQEAYAAPKAFGVAKRADFKMHLAASLASKSSLRGAILLREILGTPRGLQELDIM